MPDGSTTYNYGALETTPYKVSQMDLIFKRKILTGFWLMNYLHNVEAAPKIIGSMLKNLSTKAYQTDI
jgi:hypothetical protein